MRKVFFISTRQEYKATYPPPRRRGKEDGDEAQRHTPAPASREEHARGDGWGRRVASGSPQQSLLQPHCPGDTLRAEPLGTLVKLPDLSVIQTGLPTSQGKCKDHGLLRHHFMEMVA